MSLVTFKTLRVNILLVLLGVAFVFLPIPVAAQFNPEINYQGKLTNGSAVAVPDGLYNMNFWLIASSTAATSTAVWTEARTGGNQVQVTNGLFSVMLGEVSTLASVDFDQTLYLAVEIGGMGTPEWDGELLPRKVLGAVPAAFVAQTAATADNATALGGVASSSFLRSDEADTMTASSTGSLLTLVQNGVGKVLSLFSGVTEIFTVLSNGNVGVGTTTPTSTFSVDGNTVLDGNLDIVGAVSIDGTIQAPLLTPGRVLYSTTGSYLTDNINFVFDGTNFGVGTTTPTSRLSVSGDSTFIGNAVTTGSAYFGGNVGIGTTTPGSKLTVAGSAQVTGNIDILPTTGSTVGVITKDGNRFLHNYAAPNSSGGNIFLGLNSGNFTLGSSTVAWMGVYNIGIGNNTLQSLTSGEGNVGVGNISLSNVTTGGYNTAFGDQALTGVVVAGDNSAFGAYALRDSTGYRNSAFGADALLNLVSGSNNVAIGDNAGMNATNTNNVTMIGTSAGEDLTTGGVNTFLGYNTGRGITTGGSNTILGANVSGLSSSLSNNIIIADGDGNQRINVGSTGNVGLGTSTASSRLTVAGDIFATGAFRDSSNAAGATGYVLQTTGSGTQWVATSTLGFTSGATTFLGLTDTPSSYTANRIIFTNSGATALTDSVDFTYDGTNLGLGGDDGIAFGGDRVIFASTTAANLSFGSLAGANALGGANNFFGYGAGELLVSGDGNLFMGTGAAQQLATSSGSVVMGAYAAGGLTTYEANHLTIIGQDAGYNMGVGADNNILIGYAAADNLTSGANNLVIGYSVDIASTTGSNQLNIGNIIFGTGVDGTGTTLSSGNIGIGTSTPGSKFTVAGDLRVTDNVNIDVDSVITVAGQRFVHGYTLDRTYGANQFMGFSAGNFTLGSSTDQFLGIGNLGVGENTLSNLTTGSANTGIGQNALVSLTTAFGNTAVGASALWLNSTGASNTAVGRNALIQNTTGSSNTAVGAQALDNNTTGEDNSALGTQALIGNINGSQNTALGRSALQSNNYGWNNTAVGHYALFSASSSNNTAVGTYAGSDITTGLNNTILGEYTGLGITTGSHNTIIGAGVTGLSSSLSNNIIIADGQGNQRINVGSTGNVGLGTSTASSKLSIVGDIFATGAFRDSSNAAGTAGYVLQTTGSGTQWVATSTLGFSSGASTFLALTDTPSSYTANRIMYTNAGATALIDSADFTYDGTNLGLGGDDGIAFGGTRVISASTTQDNYTFGYQAGTGFTTGNSNVGIGNSAIRNVSTGNANNAVGISSLHSLTTGSENTAVGSYSGYWLNSGNSNTFLGDHSGAELIDSDYNTFVGTGSGRNLATSTLSVALGNNAAHGFSGIYQANRFIAIGASAGENMTTGADNNILIGYAAADNLTTGSNNLVIGYDVNIASTTGSNQLNIGNLIFGTEVDGTGSTLSSGNIGIGTTTPGSKLTVAGDTYISGGLGLGADENISFGGVAMFTASSTQNSIKIGQGAGFGSVGSQVVIIGQNAGEENGGSFNNIIGDGSGRYNEGSNNNIIGANAGNANVGNYTNLFGFDAGYFNAGDNSNLIGLYAGRSNIGDEANIFGSYAGQFNRGNNVTLIGQQAGYRNESNNAIAIGYQAMGTTTASSTGFGNVGIGYQALFNNTTGDFNTGVGYGALTANRTGSNSAFGFGALNANTTGSNSAFGYGALAFNTTGNQNSAFGQGALTDNVIGNGNSAFGSGALENSTGGYDNVAFGLGAFAGNIDGDNNVAIGNLSGRYLNDGVTIASSTDFSVYLGYGTKAFTNNDQNTIVIGYNANGIGSNSVVLGNDSITTTALKGNVGLGTTTPSSKLTVVGDFHLTGAFRDSTNASGTLGMVLQTTGTSTRWAATSTLGLYGPTASSITSAQLLSSLSNETGTGVAVFGTSPTFTTQITAPMVVGGTAAGSNLTLKSTSGVGTTDYVRITVGNNGATEALRAITNGNIGIGTTTPNSRLTVVGDAYLTGAFRDSTSATGTAGMVLQTTGTSTRWVATSTLGISGGGSLFTDGGATTYLTATGDNLGIGTTTAGSKLVVDGAIDTTDVYKIDGSTILSASTTLGNYYLGEFSGNSTMTGGGNITFGQFAGNNLTTGNQNVFIGSSAGEYIDTGYYNVAIGSYALNTNAAGTFNNAIGYTAGGNLDEGNGNNFFGQAAAQQMRYGHDNMVMGNQTAYYLATSTGSVVMGSYAAGGASLYEANHLTLIGAEAGYNMTSGANNNILIGYKAADNLTSGANNLVIGYDVNIASTTGSNQLNIGNLIFGTGLDGTGTTLSSGNIGIGTTTPQSKLTVDGDITTTANFNLPRTTGSTVGVVNMNNQRYIHSYQQAGSNGSNLFMGINSGNFTLGSSTNSDLGINNVGFGPGTLANLTTASANTAMGQAALEALTTGYGNTAAGFLALYVNTTGAGNTAIGSNSMWQTTTGSSNSAFGSGSLGSNTIGADNTALGHQAMAQNIDGSQNTAVGKNALNDNDYGWNNTAVGYFALIAASSSNNTGVGSYAGSDITTGDGNTILGNYTGIGITTGSYNTIIGANVTGLSSSLSNNIIIADGQGNRRINVDNNGLVGIGTTTPSEELTVVGTIQSTGLLGGATNLTTDANGNIIRDPSDARLKENVETLENALDTVLGLRGVRYQWIDKERFGDQFEVGFIAQEVDELVPEVVSKGGEYWSLNSKNLVAVVVEAIKEMWVEITDQKSRIEELEERIQYLESLQQAPAVPPPNNGGGSGGGGSDTGGGEEPPPEEPPIEEVVEDPAPEEEVVENEETGLEITEEAETEPDSSDPEDDSGSSEGS